MTGGEPDQGGHSRRSVLRTATAAVAGAAVGATGTAAAQGSGVDYGGWFDGVSNFDGTVDATGQSEVTVEVGAQGNGGPWAFAPAAVRVDPGTTLRFTWVSDTHNVQVESQPDGADWSGHEAIENEGFEFTTELSVEGVYKYFCLPHRGSGMKGAVVVGGEGTGDGSGGDGGGGTPQTHTVEMNDQLAYVPETITVAPGDTVVWENVGSIGHTVTAYEDDIPDGAAYFASGGFDGEDAARDAFPEGNVPGGESYEHTFETTGTYGYFCIPHEGAEMVGTVEVREGGGGGGDGDPGGSFELTPGLGMVGAAVILGLLSPVVFAVLLRFVYDERQPPEAAYGGPDAAADRLAGPPVAEEAAETDPEREIDHDEYDPRGTLALIIVYLLILVVMWVFMYFVEFVGNGPTVI